MKRGTLDADLAEVMKKLAKDKMLRALSNVAYAKGDYEKEMGQAALKKEALKNFEFVELTKYLKKLLTPTLRNSLEYTYREEGKANDDSK